MKIKMIVTLWISLLAINSCNSRKKPSLYPADFKFALKSTSFEYDSQTRRYNHFEKSIIVDLTDEELRDIYNYVKSINFLHFPNEFGCDGKESTIPCFTDRLEVWCNSMYKKTENDDCCSKIEKDRPEDFDRLVKKITDILDSKKQVKELPRYNIIYM